MPLDVIACAHGEAARDVVRAQIAQLQHDDPIRPVTVAVPSNYAGLALRRALARPSAGHPGGLLNVRFLVLARVIELLGAPVLAARGQQPLTRALHAELIRAALADQPGVFAPVADHPATERSLEYTFHELAETAAEERSALAATGRRAADVVRLFEAVRARAQGRYYDDLELAAAAAEAARVGHPALRDLGDLLLYLPGALTPAQLLLLEALSETARVVVVAGLTGDPAADAPVRTQWHIPLDLPGQPAAPPTADAIVSAPDSEEEVRQAIRLLLTAAQDGVPLHRMALLTRQPSPYAVLAAGQLDAAGIPWHGPNPRTLAQSVAGRTLLGLLALPDEDVARRAVAAWVTSTPVLTDRGEPVPAFRWEEIARSAGVVTGADGWVTRLKQHLDSLQQTLDAFERDDDSADWQRRRLQRDIAEARALLDFINELIARLQDGIEGNWETRSAWARTLLERYLGSELAVAAHLPPGPEAEAEIEAYRAVLEALDSLAALDAIRDRIDLATFRRALERELDRPARRIGRFGAGVFAGRLRDATGGDFDRVFILGMTEGVLPARTPDDPLLPEAEWTALDSDRDDAGDDRDWGDAFPVRGARRARRLAEERRLYLAALAAAPQRTLLAPRADLRGQQARLRSRWLLESAGRLAGQRVTNEDLNEAPDAWDGWHLTVPSFEGGMARTAAPASSLQEQDLRSLRAWRTAGRRIDDHPLAARSPALAAGWVGQRARRGSSFTRWDGLASSVPPAALRTALSRPQGPTSLERWAHCPRQYFFNSVLRVAEREEPELTLRLAARERGSLLHAALERFLQEAIAAGRPAAPEEPWTGADRQRLRAIGEEECDRWEANGLTGMPLLWRLDRASILRDLDRFLDDDEVFRRRFGVVPVAAEQAFGFHTPGAAPAVRVDLSPGVTVSFRGRIDRVDLSPDGSHMVVVDYKSGSTYGYRDLADDPVAGGHKLQLPVYARAASADNETIKRIDAHYWFLRDDVAPAERWTGYQVDAAVDDRFRKVLTGIASGIGTGLFPALPGPYRNENFEHCTFCAFDAICPPSRGRDWERMRGDPLLGPVIELSGEASAERDA